MSLLPGFMLEDMEETLEQDTDVVDVPREFGVNFASGQLTGQIVEGLEALRVWVWLVCHIERYRHPIFTWQYGTELEKYIGQNYSREYMDTVVKKEVEDALMYNEHILGIEDFTTYMEDDRLTMSFTVNTDLGGIEVNV